jgi:tRNA A-37 threonylcarbamoyl transferase component Bud32
MQPGARLGHYEIVAAIGRGGMGEVWKARDSKLRRDVALKTLPPELSHSPDRLARLEREAMALAAVNHPNVAAIYGLEEQGAFRFLVLELVDGETLAERLEHGPLAVKRALEVSLQIAEALEAAHERGVVHRDLKPANVKLTSDGRIKVLDFGLAKSAADETAGFQTMTEVGVVMGTAAYMSPEQARGEPTGPQTDLWAFGALLLEMLSGVSPFARTTTADTLVCVLETEPDLRALPPSLPPSARQLLRRCLEKDRRRRLKHAGDARIAVEEALAELAAPPQAVVPAQPRFSRRAALVGGAAVGAVGAAFGGAALFSRSGSEPAAMPSYHRLTFRRGMIRAARFGPDFKTILYGALWDGDVCRVYTVRPESPESSALTLPPAMPLAVSASGEVALALGTHFRGIMTYGTLARVPLAGGAPRELQENVKYADWSPDGTDLALVRREGTQERLELLSGTVLAEPETSGGGFSFVRFSPRGDAVAAFELSAAGGLLGRVVVVERSGRKRTVSPRLYFNVFGVAWRGDEVWFSAADEVPLFRNAVYAMNSAGTVRIVARVPGNTTLHDIAPDGRVLVARTDDRGGITVRAPGDAAERDLSWLDAGAIAAIAPDGQRILFSEQGVGGGPRMSSFVRAVDGGPAVRLGDGFAQSLSPDGRRAIVQPDFTGAYLEVIPTGAGSPSRLERPGLSLSFARWLADGRRAVVLAQPANGTAGLYVLDVDGTAVSAVTPSGIAVRRAGWAVSPEGSRVVVSTERGLVLFPVDGGESYLVPGTEDLRAVGWIESGILASVDPVAGGVVYRVDAASGQREVWVDIQPRDPAGMMSVDLNSLVVTPDGRAYGYHWHRATSDLYLVEGWA